MAKSTVKTFLSAVMPVSVVSVVLVVVVLGFAFLRRAAAAAVKAAKAARERTAAQLAAAGTAEEQANAVQTGQVTLKEMVAAIEGQEFLKDPGTFEQGDDGRWYDRETSDGISRPRRPDGTKVPASGSVFS